jgi:hypothetical protein
MQCRLSVLPFNYLEPQWSSRAARSHALGEGSPLHVVCVGIQGVKAKGKEGHVQCININIH